MDPETALSITTEIEEGESELQKDDQLGSSFSILKKVPESQIPHAQSPGAGFWSLTLLCQLL